jgi:hypothetical protein
MVQRLNSHGVQSNGTASDAEEFIGQGDDHIMTFDCSEVVDLHAANVSTDEALPKARNGMVWCGAASCTSLLNSSQGVSSTFRTDTDISGNLSFRERTLKKWDPAGDTAVDLSLDSSNAGWDQFETNERLYNVKSDYDENMYTTTIDRSHPEFKAREARAERIAREIEKSTTQNVHVAEERGHKAVDDSGLDEEDKWVGHCLDLRANLTCWQILGSSPRRCPTTYQQSKQIYAARATASHRTADSVWRAC